MEYLDFCEKVKLKLQELVEEGTTVRIQKVLKNNNVVRYAAIITERNSRISPSIYLENFYSDYINGRSLADVCDEVLHMHNTHKDGVTFNFEDYFNKMPQLLMTLVRAIFDLAVVFFCLREFNHTIQQVLTGFKDMKDDLEDF